MRKWTLLQGLGASLPPWAQGQGLGLPGDLLEPKPSPVTQGEPGAGRCEVAQTGSTALTAAREENPGLQLKSRF